jgi:hypothetical protein
MYIPEHSSISSSDNASHHRCDIDVAHTILTLYTITVQITVRYKHERRLAIATHCIPHEEHNLVLQHVTSFELLVYKKVSFSMH